MPLFTRDRTRKTSPPSRTYDPTRLFQQGAQFPPQDDIERLAKYARARKIFDGKHAEVYERASHLLKNTPQAAQLERLYIAVNIVDILVTKPADLMFGEPPIYESGTGDGSREQLALDSIVDQNRLNLLGHELVTSAGYRGDSFIKVYYNTRQDMSAVPAGLTVPPTQREPIIEAVNPSFVFPELSRGSSKEFKAVNIAWVEWVDDEPYLNVERHVPGYVLYERFRLIPNGTNTVWETPINTYMVGEAVPTGRDDDIVPTGVSELLVHHVPYKSVDDDWQGVGLVEKIESVLAAINDRLVQIDYILWKHSDPTAYGPPLDSKDGDSVAMGGRYIPVEKDEVTPDYMTWNSQLEGAFKQLDYLLALVFQMAETPQWLFGTNVAGDNRGGTGTSHTDSAAIKARFMPILSKVERIRLHVDYAYKHAIKHAMQLENVANEGVDGFTPYEPVLPSITWKDGIPDDEMEQAEIMAIRTGNRPTLDVQSAIKRMDEVNDAQAQAIMQRIEADEQRDDPLTDPSIFREEMPGEGNEADAEGADD